MVGVTLLQVFPDDARTVYKSAERFQARICALGATLSGMFHVDCDTYYSSSNSPNMNNKRLHILHNSETPVSSYAVLDTGNRQISLLADYTFDLILPLINHLYQPKRNLKVECKGNRFTLVDFVVKIGSVTMSSGQFKGILVEVEYRPCVIPEMCYGLMKEFMESFMGSNVLSQVPRSLHNRMHEEFSVRDTMLQYLDYFNDFRDSFSETVPVPVQSVEENSNAQAPMTNTL